MMPVSNWNIRSRYISIRHAFRRDERGNVAMLFALAMIPVMLFAGAAIDFSRALTEKDRLQQALDATALAMAKEPKTLTQAQLKALAQSYFEASFHSSAVDSRPAVNVVSSPTSVRVTASIEMPTTIMKLAGVQTVPLSAQSVANNSRRKLEIALALDNTGSMGQAGKMGALQRAVSDLITQLKSKVIEPDDVKLSIVPFNTQVKVDRANWNAAWLRWDVTLENPQIAWPLRRPPAPAIWAGCIADRDQPYDISSEPASDLFRRYVAANCQYGGLAQMSPLTTDLEMVRARANSMVSYGATNVTIGLSTGLATLRPDSPLGAASSSAPNVDKYLILLTDGDNTQNRWANTQADIDSRLTAACTQAKTQMSNIKIFTIRVIAGNANLLRNCATNASMYFDVQDASQLQPVFTKILEAIDTIRISS